MNAPTKWTAAENAALVACYLRMQALHNAGTRFSKAAERRALIGTPENPGPLAARSHGSVEFKLMNVSGCMRALQRLPLPGYAPAMNYQRELMAEVCRQLGIDPNPAPVAPTAAAPCRCTRRDTAAAPAMQ